MRLGPLFRATLLALIQGMLSRIGLLIFFSQAHVRQVLPLPAQGRSGADSKIYSTFYQVFYNKEALFSVIIGALTIAVIWVWGRTVRAALKLIPGQLVGANFGSSRSISSPLACGPRPIFRAALSFRFPR